MEVLNLFVGIGNVDNIFMTLTTMKEMMSMNTIMMIKVMLSMTIIQTVQEKHTMMIVQQSSLEISARHVI